MDFKEIRWSVTRSELPGRDVCQFYKELIIPQNGPPSPWYESLIKEDLCSLVVVFLIAESLLIHVSYLYLHTNLLCNFNEGYNIQRKRKQQTKTNTKKI